MRRLIDRLLYALHPLTCEDCRHGARRVVIGGREHHLAARPRIPWERFVTRAL